MLKHITILIFLNTFKKKNKGFTLIELITVVVIMGVLSAIAIPTLFEQVEKSRQTEAKLNLGSINRVQQGYRFEKGTFATIPDLPVQIVGKFYTYADIGTPDSQGAVHTAKPITTFENDLKDYSSAVGQLPGGAYTGIVCEQNIIDGDTPPIPATVTAGVPSCGLNTTQIF